MKKIDIADWKEFQIGELFDIHPTKAYKLTNKDLIVCDGTIPVVVNSSYNNGIGGYSNLAPTEKGNIITFSDTTSADAIFYQESEFIGYPHIQGLYALPKYKDNWNKYSLLFFLTEFRKAAYTMNVNYANKFTREIASNLTIKLPITANGALDWLYMEDFIKQIKTQQICNLMQLIKITPPIYRNNLNIKTQRFHLYDIFQIDMGTKLDKINMQTDNPEVDFVGRANENQGVTAKVNRIDGIQPYKAGNFTLALGGAYLGSCFIQRNDFYTSQNVIVLTPKEDISIEAKLYLSSVIFKESQLGYKAFLNELNPHIKTDFSIPLPITETDKPNWQFMGDYIKTITTLQSKNIQVIHSISC
ncbi:restriction endonuclease subunit S [Alistipes putredinis]|jgi:putative S-cspCI|uniref:restriction endonuclease subunit S n=2 Tax=Alistipes putredinis TaxID=28117 RepID=UPI003AB3D4DA